MSKQGTAGKKKHGALKIPQKLEIIRLWLWLHTMLDLSVQYKETGPITITYCIKGKRRRSLTLKEPKLAQV